MQYYQRNIYDYRVSTSHLSPLEHGIYVLLMDVYYAEEAPIKDKQKYRCVGARASQERNAVDFILSEFFVKKDGAWHQKRCDENVAAYQLWVARARENGRLGGRPKGRKSNVSKNQGPIEKEPTHNQGPIEKEPTHNHRVNSNNPYHGINLSTEYSTGGIGDDVALWSDSDE